MDKVELAVYGAFKDAQKDMMIKNNSERIKTWHVSDFTSPCIRKSYYQRNFPAPYDPNKTSILFHGLILHEHTKLSHFHEVTMCYDIKEDKAYTPQEVRELENTENIITGSLDDLMRIDGEYVIVDKKTYNGYMGQYKKKEPDESYKLQLSIYRVLLDRGYGIDATKGCLLYLDKSSDFTETPMAFDLAPIEGTKTYMADVLKQLKQGLPKATVNWLCNGENRKGKIFCPYKDRCENDGI